MEANFGDDPLKLDPNFLHVLGIAKGSECCSDVPGREIPAQSQQQRQCTHQNNKDITATSMTQFWSNSGDSWFLPPPIIKGGKPFGGSNICYYTFISSFIQKQLPSRKVKCFFGEFLQEMRMHQELLFVNIRKFT